MSEIALRLRERRARVEDRLAKHGLLHTLSAARYQLRQAIVAAIRMYGKGEVLEVGAGRSPYRNILLEVATTVTTLDVDAVHAPDILADIQDLETIPDERFDTILCTQVLEHVPAPHKAMAELARILKPGGILILTAPHLSMVHEAPNDFFRFTRFGLKELAGASDLEVVELIPVGGPVSFLGHLLSSAWLTVTAVVPSVSWPAWAINYALLVRPVAVIDRVIGMRSLLPRDHLMVARRVN